MTPAARRLRQRVVESTGVAVVVAVVLLSVVVALEPAVRERALPLAVVAALLTAVILVARSMTAREDLADRLDTLFLLFVAGLTMTGVLVAPVVDGTTLVLPAVLALLITFGFARPRAWFHTAVVVTLAAAVLFRAEEGAFGVVWYLGLYLLIAASSGRVADRLRSRMTEAANARRDAEAATEVTARLTRLHRLDRRRVVDAVPGLMDRLGLVTLAVDLDGAERGRPDLPEASQELRITVPSSSGTGSIVAAGPPDLSTRRREVAELVGRQIGWALDNARSYERVVATAEELAEQQRHRNEIIATLSHELRTPLTVIRGVGETLVQRGDGLPDEQRAVLLERVGANAERLQAIIEMILGFTRLEHGRVAVQARPVDVAEAAGRTVARLRPLLERHVVRLDLASGTVAEVDPELFDHLVENLLSNVARHTPPGTTVEITVRGEDAGVLVAVADDGPGIPPREVPRITDRFYQGGDASRRRVGGVGLGLALVDRILQAHGVRLHVDTEPGRGARFWFRLPAVEPGALEAWTPRKQGTP